jgi:hypothetical protein
LEKPVIMTLPSLITKGELTSLWQAGVAGLVSSLRQSGKSLGELEKMISEMPGKARGRRAKADVKLPHYDGSEVGDENEEEEEI